MGEDKKLTDAELLKQLKERFGHGDPEYMGITMDEILMYSAKNRDYAGGNDDEIVDPNGNFDRVAAFFSMYPGLSLADPRVISLVYMMKQVDQVFHSLSRGYEGSVEGLDPRLADIHIYSKICRTLNRRADTAQAAIQVVKEAIEIFKRPFTGEKGA